MRNVKILAVFGLILAACSGRAAKPVAVPTSTSSSTTTATAAVVPPITAPPVTTTTRPAAARPVATTTTTKPATTTTASSTTTTTTRPAVTTTTAPPVTTTTAHAWVRVDYLQPPQTTSDGVDLTDGTYRLGWSCYFYSYGGCTLALHRGTPTGYTVWQGLVERTTPSTGTQDITLTAERYYLTAAYGGNSIFFTISR